MPLVQGVRRLGLARPALRARAALDGAAAGVHICPPAIDPLSPKNMALSPEDAAFVCDQFGIDVDRPLMCQVSRFDPWKDPMGVIDAYRLVTQEMPEVQLALVGSMATDDPEGWEFFNSTMAYADGDPDIHILNNLNNVGAIEVNAFQSQADVVIQKSTREGFGLTVSEALWKGRPFIGGDVGGIPLQVQDGETGFLVSSPDECADRSLRILREPDLGKQLGRAGKEHVRKHFLTPRLLRDWLRHLPGPPMTGDAPLVLVSNRGPATFEDGRAPARRRRARDRAAGARPPPRRGLGGLGDDRGGRRGLRASTAAARFEVELDGDDVPVKLVDERPRGLRPLLQRRGEPDAVVHPALPLGPLERARHPPPRGRGLRARLLHASTRTSRAPCSRRSRATTTPS